MSSSVSGPEKSQEMNGLFLAFKGKLSSAQFERYLRLARMVGRFDPNKKVWYIDAKKLALVDKIQLKIVLSEVTDIEFQDMRAIEFLKKLVDDVKLVPSNDQVVLDGLYFKYRIVKDFEFLDRLKTAFSKMVKRFNHVSGSYEEGLMEFYIFKGNTFVAHRGLYKLFRKVYTQFYGQEPKIVNPYNIKIADIEVPSKIAGFELRDYQIEAVKNALKDIAEIGGFLIQSPTGSGKTVMGSAIIKLLTDNGFIKNAFIIMNSTSLATQWHEFLERFFNKRVGLYIGDKKEISDITVATTQSLWTRVRAINDSNVDILNEGIIGSLKNSDFVMLDEVHHLPADTVKSIMSLNDKIHGGLSATPWRDDELDEVIYGLTSLPSIQLKFSSLKDYLVMPKIINTVIDFAGEHDVGEDENLNDDEGEEEVGGSKRYVKSVLSLLNDQKIWNFSIWLAGQLVQRNIYPVIIHSPYESVAFKISQKFNIPLISGKVKGAERDAILNQLRERKLKIVLATTVIDEGIDIPSLMGLIELFPGSSRVKVIQRIGRLVRKYPGKNTAYAFLFHYVIHDDPWLTKVLERQKAKRDSTLSYEEGWKRLDVYWKDVLNAIQ